MKQKTIIYVLNKKGQPLMPTTRCGHVRKLLKEGKAVPVNNFPFTIKLKYDTPDIVQDLYLGIDTGRENIGVGVSNINGDCFYLAELKTNNKIIKQKIYERRIHRKDRRRHKRIKKQRKAIRDNTTIQNGESAWCRTKKACKSKKVRYPGMTEGAITHKVIQGAEAQFNNKKNKSWINPSYKQCIQMHILSIKQITNFLPINHITIEKVSFDFQKLENPNIENWQYCKGPLFGFKDYKDYINHEQNGLCLLCGKKHIEYYHHIVQRKDGGTDNVKNIAGLCYDCHYGKDGVHNNEIAQRQLLNLKKKSNSQYEVGLLNGIMYVLMDEISDYCLQSNIIFNITNGKETSTIRNNLNLHKTHCIDAYCISLANRNLKFNNIIFPKKIFLQKRFKKKNKNFINKLNTREYWLDDKLVAINRHKATDQKEDSLEEYMRKYSTTHTDKECRQHFHKLEIKPAKRTYNYNKKGLISPIHVGDKVMYEKYNKNNKCIAKDVFIATSIKMSEGKVRYDTKGKKLKFCKRIESGCIPIIDYLILNI